MIVGEDGDLPTYTHAISILTGMLSMTACMGELVSECNGPTTISGVARAYSGRTSSYNVMRHQISAKFRGVWPHSDTHLSDT